MKLLNQIRVAVVGMPDSGKSTFIKNLVKSATGKELSVDTLMNEVHYSCGTDPYGNPDTRTIKCAKIMFKYMNNEICMYDCPGHKEYADQITQGLDSAEIVIKLVDFNRKNESIDYFKEQMFDFNDKMVMTLISHSPKTKGLMYDVEQDFQEFAEGILTQINQLVETGLVKTVDVEQEAINYIQKELKNFTNIGMFFSGGKDSLVGLKLAELAGVINDIKVYWPKSGDDFREVEDIIKTYGEIFKKDIIPFWNNNGQKPDDVQPFTWMTFKAKANNNLISNENLDCVLVQYRASDEGVRSKDYHIVKKADHYRLSPVFYFSETNIWRFIEKYQLPICELYYKGYRSLGDKFCTEPCMDVCSTVEDIINYIDNHPATSERDGRTKQDKAEDYTMERLRNVGFF